VKKAPRLKAMFLFPVLVIVGSTWGVQRAQAEPVDMFTGSWNVGAHGIPSGLDQTAYAAVDTSTFSGIFMFNPEVGVCNCPPSEYPPPDSSVSWSGTFDGGSVHADVYGSNPNTQFPEWEFDGAITGGSFSGGATDEGFEYSTGNQQMLSFTGTWSLVDPITGALSPIGWRSEGTLDDSANAGIGYGYTAEGTLTLMTCTTPEPAGMTLLGLGMIAVGFLRRRRLTNSSLHALRQNGPSDTKPQTQFSLRESAADGARARARLRRLAWVPLLFVIDSWQTNPGGEPLLGVSGPR
jgi:hypothetical protein